MTWYLEGAATPELDGPNWTPPTIGNFIAGESTRIRRLREADATRQVAREARMFHEKKALKYGVNTKRGLAHFRASLRYGREGRLQEMFGDAADNLPPKAWAKASTDAARFHQKQAEKHGLDTPIGQAHVAEMQHHQEMASQALQQHKQLSQQKAQQQAQQPKPSKIVKPAPMQASSEGGPGSGPRPKLGGQYRREWKSRPREKGSQNRWAQDYPRKKKEALPGHSSKQSPVPVPKKSEQPSEDIRQNKPPIPLDPQDANKQMSRLQQGQNCNAAGEHAGIIRAGGPGSGRHADPGKTAEQHGYKHSGTTGQGTKLYSHPNGSKLAVRTDGTWSHSSSSGAKIDSGRRGGNLSSHLKKESRESRIRNFAREGGRGPYDDQECTLPRKVRKQMGNDLLFRARRTGEAGNGNYVSPRYDKSHPEGFTDKRYSGLKQGVEDEGGPGSGRHEGSGTAAKFLSQELRKRGMKSKDVPDVTSYKKESKRRINPRVMESNRDEDEPKLIDLREFYAAPSNAPGWRGGVAFSPGTPKVQQQESGLVIKEF